MLGKACTSIPLRLAKLQCRKAWLVHLLLLGRQVTLHLNASLIRYSFFATFSRMFVFFSTAGQIVHIFLLFCHMAG